jgi:hypothetical protein
MTAADPNRTEVATPARQGARRPKDSLRSPQSNITCDIAFAEPQKPQKTHWCRESLIRVQLVGASSIRPAERAATAKI